MKYSAYTSIYNRLLGFLALFLVLCVCAAGFFAFKSARIEIKEDFDSQMSANSNLIYLLIHEELDEKNNLNEIQRALPEITSAIKVAGNEDDEYDKWHGFRIWKNNSIILKSNNAPDRQKISIPSGFHNITWGSEKWRVFSRYYPDQSVSIEMWENLDNRDELYEEILAGFAQSLAIMLPISIFLLYFIIRSALSRMQSVLLQIEKYNPESLENISITNLPREMQPILSTLNNLIAKIRNSLDRERMFINNAAHELRTPLTALNLQAQLLLKDNPSSDISLSIMKAVTKASHLVNQLLTLARIGHYSMTIEKITLADMLHDICAERAPIVSSKNIEVSFLVPRTISLDLAREPLRILLCTVIDNAIKYTPENGRIEISATGRHLAISDSGPGIPNAEHEKVFEKFYRAKNIKTQDGSGLGLSIAKEIAALLHIGIRLEDSKNLGGLCVRLDF